MHAEAAYLFRHALLQAAAYELQVPSARRELHRLAFRLIDALPAPEPATEPGWHLELAHHAGLGAGEADDGLRQAELLHLQHGARAARRRYDHHTAADAWRRVVESPVVSVTERAEAHAERAAALAKLGIWGAALEQVTQGFMAATDHPRARAKLLAERAGILRYQGRAVEALADYEAAVASAREAGDEVLEANMLSRVAGVELERGNLDVARQGFSRALEVAEQTGARRLEAGQISSLGVIHKERSEFAEALTCYRRAVRMAQELGDLTFEALNHSSIANVEFLLGRPLAAMDAYREAIRLDALAGDVRGLMLDRGNLAIALGQQGNFAEALPLFEATLGQAREIGDLRFEAAQLSSLAVAYQNRREFGRARELFAQALPGLRRTSNRRGEAMCRGNLGCVLLDLGEFPAALEHLDACLHTLHELGNRDFVAYFLIWRAAAAVLLGDAAGARRCLSEAETGLATLGPAHAWRVLHNTMLLRLAALCRGPAFPEQDSRLAPDGDALARQLDQVLQQTAFEAEVVRGTTGALRVWRSEVPAVNGFGAEDFSPVVWGSLSRRFADADANGWQAFLQRQPAATRQLLQPLAS